MNLKLVAIIVLVILIAIFSYLQINLNFSQNLQNSYDNVYIPKEFADSVKNISTELEQLPDDSSLNNEVDSLDKTIKQF